MTAAACDILAISTHPDDVELACGGTLCLATSKGLTVYIADLTDGEASTRGDVQRRREEATEAALLLGIKGRISVGLEDSRIEDTVAQAEKLVQVLRVYRPKTVLIPVANDRHPDHVAASALCKRAVFLARLINFLGGGAHRVDKIMEYPGHHPIQPTIVVDVSSYWDQRMRALSAYVSQFSTVDGPDTILSGDSFLRFIEARAVYYGAMIGARFGEGYRTDGPVGIADVRGLLNEAGSEYRCFL